MKGGDAGAELLEVVSVTGEEYLKKLIEPGGVIRDIKCILPHMKNYEIIVQHDGAKAHTKKSNQAAFVQAGTEGGWHMKFDVQPAQSPDLNKNDLAFFYSLQCQVNKMKGKSKDSKVLLACVKNAFKVYDKDVLERLEAIQMEIYRKILEDDGGNDYKIPHSGIRVRQKSGQDVANYVVTAALYEQAKATVLRLRALPDQ